MDNERLLLHRELEFLRAMAKTARGKHRPKASVARHIRKRAIQRTNKLIEARKKASA